MESIDKDSSIEARSRVPTVKMHFKDSANDNCQASDCKNREEVWPARSPGKVTLSDKRKSLNFLPCYAIL